MQQSAVRRLRPYLFTRFKYCQNIRASSTQHASTHNSTVQETDQTRSHDYEKRIAQLEAYRPLQQCFPRFAPEEKAPVVDVDRFETKYHTLAPNGTDLGESFTLAGRIKSVRTAGSKLCFVDVEVRNGQSLQAVCQLSKLDSASSVRDFKILLKLMRRGDVVSFEGHPHRTERGQLSVLATRLPVLLSPSLHQVPDILESAELRARARHVDMLVNPSAIETLQLRHLIEKTMQEFFNSQGFIKVNTPLLSNSSGGANARPFETEATEFPDEKISLRIAPELWLKRLIIGGMSKVYEIGPAFRNEGVDLTHNPEFTICEFYHAYATLPDLINLTQSLFTALLTTIIQNRFPSLTIPSLNFTSVRQIEFLPTLNTLLPSPLPPLTSPTILPTLHSILETHQIPLPSPPTLNRCLDALSEHFLEPLSHTEPIFITHHPASTSPLSKHFLCPKTNEMVAARAELFVGGRELANMYEEENDPFAQREKFVLQQAGREAKSDASIKCDDGTAAEVDGDPEAMVVDEAYLRAMEWGMPPTGGWGCGVDRLVMLFGGRERIADVLPFGTLRNVVGLKTVGRKGSW